MPSLPILSFIKRHHRLVWLNKSVCLCTPRVYPPLPTPNPPNHQPPEQSSTAQVGKSTLGVVVLIRPHYGRPVWGCYAGFLHLIAFDCMLWAFFTRFEKPCGENLNLFQTECTLPLDFITPWLCHVLGAVSFDGGSFEGSRRLYRGLARESLGVPLAVTCTQRI